MEIIDEKEGKITASFRFYENNDMPNLELFSSSVSKGEKVFGPYVVRFHLPDAVKAEIEKRRAAVTIQGEAISPIELAGKAEPASGDD